MAELSEPPLLSLSGGGAENCPHPQRTSLNGASIRFCLRKRADAANHDPTHRMPHRDRAPAWGTGEPNGYGKFSWPIDRVRAALTAMSVGRLLPLKRHIDLAADVRS